MQAKLLTWSILLISPTRLCGCSPCGLRKLFFQGEETEQPGNYGEDVNGGSYFIAVYIKNAKLRIGVRWIHLLKFVHVRSDMMS